MPPKKQPNRTAHKVTYRITPDRRVKIDELARAWGGIAGPATIQATIDTAIDRAHASEAKRARKTAAEDAADIEAARKALDDIRVHGTVPLDKVKKKLGL